MIFSIIIPVYNEGKAISYCLASLAKQTTAINSEIIIVDDRSTDNTLNKIREARREIEGLRIEVLKQKHTGPGAARNLGARSATGEILVFVDADMEFAPDFVEKLTKPIFDKQALGTFSREEYLLNKTNAWARYWNLNLGRETERMIGGGEYKMESPVFRAILKSKFNEVGGFDTSIGYTDDWSLSRKLGGLAVLSPGAIFYHRNPDCLKEVWVQARWFGKNEFLTKDPVRKLYNLWRYCPLWAIFKLYDFHFSVFKLVYNSAVSTSIILSFFGEQKNK